MTAVTASQAAASPSRAETDAAFPLADWMAARRDRVEQGLAASVSPAACQAVPGALNEALAYPLLAGGKRLRPLLVLAGAEAVGGDADSALIAALAVECVHTYSLVHDDLPSMDDDSLRRGRPTTHIVFGEAMAVS